MGAHNKGQENRVAIFPVPWYHNTGIQMFTVEVQYEQSSQEEYPVCPGRTCADWFCHVGALGQPEHSASRRMGVSAQRDLSFSVQRMGLFHTLAHCADPGAAVSSGNFRADGAVAAASLHQVRCESGGILPVSLVRVPSSHAVYSNPVCASGHVLGTRRELPASPLDSGNGFSGRGIIPSGTDK